jgi:hypothetical protein
MEDIRMYQQKQSGIKVPNNKIVIQFEGLNLNFIHKFEK